jgi:hypothetical protein
MQAQELQTSAHGHTVLAAYDADQPILYKHGPQQQAIGTLHRCNKHALPEQCWERVVNAMLISVCVCVCVCVCVVGLAALQQWVLLPVYWG